MLHFIFIIHTDLEIIRTNRATRDLPRLVGGILFYIMLYVIHTDLEIIRTIHV
jgi:hypothetical protein